MEFGIREGLPSDYESVARLVAQIQAIHAEARPDIFAEDPCPMSQSYYLKLLDDRYSKLYVVTAGDIITGYAVIRINKSPLRSIYQDRRYISIDDLCVDESYRGRGMGRALLKHIFDYAKEIGAGSVELSVSEFNEGAIRLYESMGMSTRSRRMEITLD
ncbi:GNAT family N-acetyltransferase [Neobacillus mesonae]|nr:GNAT family N-acetyltransferase [Neobacillus mesonae]